jgi:hypothetical protein
MLLQSLDQKVSQHVDEQTRIDTDSAQSHVLHVKHRFQHFPEPFNPDMLLPDMPDFRSAQWGRTEIEQIITHVTQN